MRTAIREHREKTVKKRYFRMKKQKQNNKSKRLHLNQSNKEQISPEKKSSIQRLSLTNAVTLLVISLSAPATLCAISLVIVTGPSFYVNTSQRSPALPSCFTASTSAILMVVCSVHGFCPFLYFRGKHFTLQLLQLYHY